MTSAPKLLLPPEYAKEAADRIRGAKSHVSMLCLTMSPGDSTGPIIDALCDAAKSGVDVEVAADIFIYGEIGGHLIPIKYYRKKSRPTTEMAKRLMASGVKFTWLGQFSATPFTGRTHIKCLVVDDTVFSFGGINPDDRTFTNNDYMLMVSDTQLALELRDDIARLIKADGGGFAYRSHEFSYMKTSRVLIDGGFQGDSLIYRRACALAKEAKSIIFVSQYCPTGKLGRILRQKRADLYFNPPANATLLNRVVIGTGMFFGRHQTLYTRGQYLHAKFMLFTMPDGRKVALTGSHNFVYGGVLLGTREIALETEDKKIIKLLEKFYKRYVV